MLEFLLLYILTFSVCMFVFERTVVRDGKCHYITFQKLGPRKVLNGPQIEINRLMEAYLKHKLFIDSILLETL